MESLDAQQEQNPFAGIFTNNIYTTFSQGGPPRRYNLTPDVSALHLAEPDPSSTNTDWMDTQLSQEERQDWAQWNQQHSTFQAFQFEQPALRGTLLSPIDREDQPRRSSSSFVSFSDARRYLKAVRRHDWKV